MPPSWVPTKHDMCAAIVAVTGLAAVALDIAWFGRAYQFLHKRTIYDSTVLGDYNNSDHVFVSIAIVAAGTLMHFVMTCMRANPAYNRSLHDKPFAVTYCIISGVTSAFLVVTYAYYLINLPKFNDAYAKAGFSDLRNNGLPTAAFVMTVIYISGQTGFTVATQPSLEFQMQGVKGVGNV